MKIMLEASDCLWVEVVDERNQVVRKIRISNSYSRLAIVVADTAVQEEEKEIYSSYIQPLDEEGVDDGDFAFGDSALEAEAEAAQPKPGDHIRYVKTAYGVSSDIMDGTIVLVPDDKTLFAEFLDNCGIIYRLNFQITELMLESRHPGAPIWVATREIVKMKNRSPLAVDDNVRR